MNKPTKKEKSAKTDKIAVEMRELFNLPIINDDIKNKYNRLEKEYLKLTV